MRRVYIFWTLLILLGLAPLNTAIAQNSLLTFNEDYYHLVDRYAILSGNTDFCTSIKPFNRAHLENLILSHPDLIQSKADKYNFDLLRFDQWDVLPQANGDTTIDILLKRRFQYFYPFKTSFFAVNHKDLKLVVNPVLGFASGKSNDDNIYRNTRGVDVRGSIGGKVGFYTFISENQFVYPDYYTQQVKTLNAIPGTGFIKRFGNNGYDFFNARGYITVQLNPFIHAQFGHDNNFFGNGYRSLIWSDFAKENLFLKLHTKVWRFNYVNIFSELTDYRFDGTKHQQKKYSAFHYLNINVIPKKLDIGVFENIVFARNDSNQVSGFELNYLNPIIFYRAAEHGLNSTDNSILGADLKWNFAKSFSFYSQIVLDEFHKDEIVNRTGSWVNKWAYQAGLKYLNAFGLPNLDVQIETNVVRPYVYTHFKTDQNWANYSQPMAHPLGANFNEVLGILRYQVTPKMNVVLKYFHILHGADSSLTGSTSHFGGNIYADYYNRPKDDGIAIGDGVQRKIDIIDFKFSYQIYPNILFDLRVVNRNENADAPLTSFNTNMVIIGVRMNIASQRFDF